MQTAHAAEIEQLKEQMEDMQEDMASRMDEMKALLEVALDG